jgi:hypothetical protein
MPAKGQHLSPESRARLAAVKRGIWHSVVCACGCGTRFSLPDHRIRSSTTGRFFVDQAHTRALLRREQHPNWRGGAVDYGPDWPQIARAMRARDQVCQSCGKTRAENGRALDVHHKVPWRVSRDNSPENLTTLCKVCHSREKIAEETRYPWLADRTRHCVVCNAPFVPRVGCQKLCSPACVQKRRHVWQRRYAEKATEQQTDAYKRRRARITAWQQANRDRVNASHRAGRARKANGSSHGSPHQV